MSDEKKCHHCNGQGWHSDTGALCEHCCFGVPTPAEQWDCGNCNMYFYSNPGPHCPACGAHHSIYSTKIKTDETEN